MKTLRLAVMLVAFAPGCGDDTSTGVDGSVDLSVVDLGPAGGPVAGMQDNHCAAMGDMGATMQPTSQSVCHPDLAGSPQDGGTSGPMYGDTMYNSSGNDDDCKYFVSWTSTPIRENTPVTFTVVAKVNDAGMEPVTGAMIRAEVFLDANHSAANSGTVGAESPTGTYTITGVVFDKPGMWTVRFHLFEDCLDFDPASPHGHAAFYVNVP